MAWHDVDAVHPHVTGEADVEQVRHRLSSRRAGRFSTLRFGDRPGQLGPGLHGLGVRRLPLGDQLLGGEVGALAHLDLVHAVPPELPADLLPSPACPCASGGGTREATPARRRSRRRGRPSLARPTGCNRSACASPSGAMLRISSRTSRFSTAVSRMASSWSMRGIEVTSTVADGGHGHRDCLSLVLVATGCRSRRRASPTMRAGSTHRSPPGSFATC